MRKLQSRLSPVLIALAAWGTLPARSHAQLDASCMVSAFNRTAPVQADGVWVLPNVPANLGQVRVRATCVKDGVLSFGASSLITVPADGVIKVEGIDFQGPPPVPSSLRLDAPLTALGAIGQTVQLSAVATYPDGSTADVTAAVTGTDYRTSNPALATVDGNGLITARASGVALVSAVNEGALGVIRIQVVTSGDSDGDGIPDDWELGNGLDPNNPVDALDDQDEDGLTTLTEYQSGLNPFNADSDGDGLKDGREVNEVGTNPLLFDTDGDQVSDGLELVAGSNPLDPNSVNLGPILQALTVQPSAFTLVFNTAIGEASRRLTITARLIDGTEINVRSRRYGTNYSSSDLSIAGFGAEDGVIFAGQDGTATVTVTLAAFSAQTSVRVETFAPTPLSFLALSGYPNGVAVDGDIAYVASGSAGLHIVDATDLTRPVRLATVPLPGNANDVRVDGGYAFVAAGSAGLQIVDVLDPMHPHLIGAVDTPGDATDVAVRGRWVYIADGLSGLQVIDAAVPASPQRIAGILTAGTARGVDVVDDLVVLATGGGGVQVISVADPSSPVVLGTTHTRGSESRAASVAVRGRLAYVADGAIALGGLRVIDFQNPSTPVVIGSTSDAFGLVDVALDGGFALCADYYYPNAVPIFEIGASPQFNAVLDFYQAPSFRDDNGNGIAVRNDGVVFMVGTVWEVADNGGWANGGLHIGRWRIGGDDLGIPPEATITAPVAGFSVLERTLLTVRATASDDLRVESVEFLVDGQPVARVYKAPYETAVRIPVGVSSLRIGAVATDLAGNRGTAREVTINVIPDDKPTVNLLAPTAGLRIVEGTTISLAADATDDLQVSSVDLRLNGVSRGVVPAPPYRVYVQVPAGATQITAEAVATDSVGQTATTGPLTFTVESLPPPIVAITSPASGIEVTQGAVIRVTASAFSDLAVASVRLLVNGQPTPSAFSAPYEFNAQMPSSGTEAHIVAVATDTLGHTATSAEVVLYLVPDPRTTAVGSVVLSNGQPLAGADVVCRGVSGRSSADGSFSIAGVPTVAAITCSASGFDAQGLPIAGSSATAPPVLGGVTDVGPIKVAESLFITDLGTNLNLLDGTEKGIHLKFPFPFMGRTYSDVVVNTEGCLMPGFSSSRDSTESASDFVSGFRDDIGGVVNLPTIAAFWDDLFPVRTSVIPGEPADFYQFQGAAGDAIVAEVTGQVDGSFVDPGLTLYNAEGTAIYSDIGPATGARIAYSLPATGTFYLRVVDLNGNGGPDFFYHLTLTAGGVPLHDAGTEIEPNDTFTNATPIVYGDRVAGGISSAVSNTLHNVFVNSQLSNRFVVTWNRLAEYALGGSTTVQLSLFKDGRIQMVYNGITSDDALVGITASDGGPAQAVDFSADAPLSVGFDTAIYEELDGPVGPDGRGEDPPGNRPFDLDGRAVIFTPNAAGGYDVRVTGAPGSASASLALKSAKTDAESMTTGVVQGSVLLNGPGPYSGLTVEVTSSADPDWRGRTKTDRTGRFHFEGVPAGGINVAVYVGGHLRAHAAGILTEGGHLVLELRPVVMRPKL
jgi:hypothetical protein